MLIEPYNVGKTDPKSCEYEFDSERADSGTFMSPTYPGTYPNILNCTYKFKGQLGQRLSIYFEDISLHFGADQ